MRFFQHEAWRLNRLSVGNNGENKPIETWFEKNQSPFFMSKT
ncbi:hypothetical protein HMPREF0645_0983 [Hallella bergensis DSM 17361]|uniref:Uncharacterized protein n=1 Tax=Hallella bergensis DSM 17361 TaxID=585502 RepID=D1PVJ8_9BACT|nr:hypothetical protein HMPREF0645_0983 [Hallella bergensis DSM 17361]